MEAILLDKSHLPAVQSLLERCSEFNQLVSGEEVGSNAAREEFEEMPPGMDIADKFLLGFFEAGDLVGLLEAIRNYPEKDSWWISLFLLAPEARGKGIGRQIIRAFESWVRREFGCNQIGLGVVGENKHGYLFWEHIGYKLIGERPPRRFGCKMQSIFVFQHHLDI